MYLYNYAFVIHLSELNLAPSINLVGFPFSLTAELHTKKLSCLLLLTEYADAICRHSTAYAGEQTDWMKSTVACLCSSLPSHPPTPTLPVTGTRGCGSWPGRRVSPGCVENRWPLVPRSPKGRSKIKAQRAQPQESEVKRQGLSERAAGWSGPLGIAEDCVSVCVCM